jgi:hypothetical protein
MRTKMTAIALSAGLALGGAALVTPSAFAQDSSTSPSTSPSPTADRAASRLTSIAAALKGLVSDGTITQAQADKVASTLSTSDALHGPGGRGGGRGDKGGRLSPEATATVLGITVEELTTARDAGKTLAQIAEAEGVSKADLISGLVAAARTQIAADVTAGRLTQARADAKLATLTADITEKVDAVRPARPAGDATTSTTAPSASATS